jgi:CRP-like cAMP-binding protein
VAFSFPGIGEALWRHTVSDAAISAEWIVNVGQRDARSRLAHLFCEMAVRHDKVSGNAFEFEFPVSQANLADATGMSVVHTNRSLQSLRRAGTLQMRGGIVAVEDWATLQATAEFDSAYLNMQPPVRFAAVI